MSNVVTISTRLRKAAAAKYVGLSVPTLTTLARDGEIGFYQIGAEMRFSISELDRYLASRYVSHKPVAA